MQSICGPRKVISLPRTVMFTEGKAASTARRLSSCEPIRATMGIAVGTVMSVRSINAKSIFNLGARPVHAHQEDAGEREKLIGQPLRQC